MADSMYTCEEVYNIIKNLMAQLSDPSFMSGNEYTEEADDMKVSRKTSASSVDNIIASIRFWYNIYKNLGCGELPEIEAILNSQHKIILGGRAGFTKGRVIC